MIKILITDKLAKEGIDLLKTIDGVEPVVKTGISPEELISIIGEYDGLIVRSETKATAKVLEKPGKLRGIARAGAGVDNIDVPMATKKGILVMNTPGGNTLSAAEHTMALMLSMSRHVVPACTKFKGGVWDKKSFMGNQLNNKVLGVIGLGRIGMAVAKMATGFNMKILGYDPVATPPDAEKLGIEMTDNLERIFKEADYITVHVPKNEKTLNMIGEAQLKMMKPTMRIVNCARGGIINEDALYDALEKKTIAAAALDVFTEEPPVKNKRYEKIPNLIVTPHLGASTEEAQVEVAVEAAQILADYLKTGAIKNAVNAPATGGAVPTVVNTYATLAERIGTLVSVIAGGQIKKIELQYRGAIAEHSVGLITSSFQIGLLRPFSEDPVNMINASALAKEKGISVDVTKNPEAKNVASGFGVKVGTAKGECTFTGTVFNDKIMRIIEINGFDVEMTPADNVMIIFNDDKPGVIGAVGTVLGKGGINIQTMGVGQKAAEKKAILAVSLDAMPDEKTVKAISELDFVNEVHLCKLS
ncbi:MAG: phosphoglycerate dehydrogenase [Planctomycetes bacterium RBG_13_44_8b]|nr:MAG: phosphoglycerate dehydrogenase [Planctomycetes bacterium RBG_13_44_8b]